MSTTKYRSAITGKYVSNEFGDANPKTTVKEKSANPSKKSNAGKKQITKTSKGPIKQAAKGKGKK